MKKNVLNNVTLVGRLYQHSLENKVSKKGVNYIGGTIDIATDDECLNVVTVNYSYIAPTYPAKGDKPERPNPNYAIAQKLIDAAKTVVTDGKDEALKIKLTPNMTVNDFPNREGEMVSAKRLDGGFISVVNALPDEKERNRFDADVLINGTKVVEANPEKGVDKDYLVVKGNVFNFAGAMMPVEFVVRSEGGIRYFESLDASNDNPVFTKVWGRIISVTTVTTVEEATAFGEPNVKTYPKTSKHWEITGAAESTYEIGDEENGITADEISKAIADRKVHLAEVMQRAAENSAAKAAAPAGQAGVTAATGGFNW